MFCQRVLFFKRRIYFINFSKSHFIILDRDIDTVLKLINFVETC